jgi:hypothetical protein
MNLFLDHAIFGNSANNKDIGVLRKRIFGRDWSCDGGGTQSLVQL